MTVMQQTVQTGLAALNSSGVATVPFPAAFASKPVVALTAENSTNAVISISIASFATDGSGDYTGMQVKGLRLASLAGVLTIQSGAALNAVAVHWQAKGVLAD